MCSPLSLTVCDQQRRINSVYVCEHNLRVCMYVCMHVCVCVYACVCTLEGHRATLVEHLEEAVDGDEHHQRTYSAEDARAGRYRGSGVRSGRQNDRKCQRAHHQHTSNKRRHVTGPRGWLQDPARGPLPGPQIGQRHGSVEHHQRERSPVGEPRQGTAEKQKHDAQRSGKRQHNQRLHTFSHLNTKNNRRTTHYYKDYPRQYTDRKTR